MQGLDQQHAVNAVDEVDRRREAQPVLEQDVDGAGLAHDEREAEDADEWRRNDRDQREIAEEVAPREIVAHQQKRDGDAEHRRGGDGAESQQQRIPERAPVERVPREGDKVLERQTPALVAEGVVEDAQQRVHDEDDHEDPDQRDAQCRQCRRHDGARGRDAGRACDHCPLRASSTTSRRVIAPASVVAQHERRRRGKGDAHGVSCRQHLVLPRVAHVDLEVTPPPRSTS